MDAPHDVVDPGLDAQDIVTSAVARSRSLQISKLMHWLRENLVLQWHEVAPEHVADLEKELALLCDLSLIIQEQLESASGFLEKLLTMVSGVQVAVDLVEEASRVNSIPSTTKCALAMSILEQLFKLANKGVDGDKTRIKIPWLTPGVSDALLGWLLKYGFRFGLEIAVLRFKK